MVKIILVIMSLLLFGFKPYKPEELHNIFKDNKPYSQAVLNKLFIKIYEAQIWCDCNLLSYEENFALSLTYDINITKGNLINRTIDEMKNIVPVSDENINYYRQKLEGVFPDVKQNDRITALYLPNKKLEFFHNGKITGTITDMVFAKNFLDIWLSDKSSEPKMRNQLIKVKYDKKN